MGRNDWSFSCTKLFINIVLAIMCLMHNALVLAEQVEAKAISFWLDAEPESQLKVNNTVWQGLLDKYLDDQHPTGINRFDYRSVSEQDQKALSDYIDFLQGYDPRQFNQQQQKAYWINLYNATIVDLVLREEPSSSVKRMLGGGVLTSGVWKRKIFKIAGRKLTLYDIRNSILRPLLKDPRVHYALNFASLSCPNLQKQAYTADNIDALLDQAARDYINHSRGGSVEGNVVELSSIYDWYRADFDLAKEKNVLAHLEQYAEQDLIAKLATVTKVSYDYDWGVNRP